MKCPKCKAEGFSIIKYRETFHKTKPVKAVMGCKECGRKEVFN